MTLGERIYTMRTTRNLSQIDLANALDVSRQSVSKWETDASVPELDKLVRMCELFDVSMDELIRGRQQEYAVNFPQSAVGKQEIERRKSSKAAKIVGIILLVLTALMILPMLALLSTIYWNTVLAVWFTMLTAGIICLSVKRNVALWTILGMSFVYTLVVTVCNLIVQIRLVDMFPFSALVPNFMYVGVELLMLVVTALLVNKKK